jgi:hypothetical protein
LQKASKKQKEKTPKYNNPYDDIFFWLSIAAVDFSSCMAENDEELKHKSEKHIFEN